jgi:hypothetical protein
MELCCNHTTEGDHAMIDLSATLMGVISFVLVVLATCGITYYHADRLQRWAEKTFKKGSNQSS